MSKDNDLYGDDIRLWSEAQSALLRRLSAGEAVADQIDWPHVVEAIEHSQGGPEHQDEIARKSSALGATICRANSAIRRPNWPLLRMRQKQRMPALWPPQRPSRLSGKPDAKRRARGLLERLRSAWRGQ
jgi:hypothetical protein